MSLSALIDRLGSLVSKYFVIGSFIPVLIFAAANSVLFYRELPGFRAWADPQIAGTVRVFDVTLVLIGLAVAAYLLSSVNVFLRQVLEGRHLLPAKLARWWTARQQERLSGIQKRYYQARNEAAGIAAQKPNWQKQLTEAATEGKRKHPRKNDFDGETGPCADELKKVRGKLARAEPPTLAELKVAVAKLSDELKLNDMTEPHPATGRKTLAEARRELLILFDDAEDSWSAIELASFNEQQARFGIGAVAPTAIGNIALSMQSYGITRYRLNLDTFWSRLQPVLEKNEKFYSGLLDAKVQLDFLVACFWLSLATTVFWVIALAIVSHSVGLFLLVALLGPVVTWLFYRMSAENYVVFGEMIRTSVDLYRFSLLESLHVALPVGIRDERALWDALQKVSSFGQEWVDLSYRHGSESPPA